jgi:nitroreductase
MTQAQAITADFNFEELERIMLRQRAVRLFTDQPVEDAMLERLIRAATFAPSGGNRQPWRFIIIRDRATKAALGKIFDELGQQFYGANAPERTPWADVPALIAVCAEESGGPSGAGAAGASVYPVVQNLLLAIHGFGLGSVLTTRWKAREAEVKPLLGLPDNMDAYAILPVGWPIRRYGRGKRMPVKEITYREKFGQAW